MNNKHKDCSFKGTYCIATKDTFEALLRRGINSWHNYSYELQTSNGTTPFFELNMEDNDFVGTNSYGLYASSEQIYYIKEHDCFTDVEPKKPDTLSIEHEAKKEHFAKFGFEVPEFECELLKIYKDKIIVGSANNPYISNDLIPLSWDTEGNCSDIEFDLTPLPIVEEAKPTKEELIKDKVDIYTKLLEWVIDYQDDLEGDWYICKPNHLWKMYNPINNGQPDTVMMKRETAEALCKALNDGSFSLHIERKKSK